MRGADAGDSGIEDAHQATETSLAAEGSADSGGFALRIACGQATAVIDGEGVPWGPDQFFDGGTPDVDPIVVDIKHTDSPILYNGQRYASE